MDAAWPPLKMRSHLQNSWNWFCSELSSSIISGTHARLALLHFFVLANNTVVSQEFSGGCLLEKLSFNRSQACYSDMPSCHHYQAHNVLSCPPFTSRRPNKPILITKHSQHFACFFAHGWLGMRETGDMKRSSIFRGLWVEQSLGFSIWRGRVINGFKVIIRQCCWSPRKTDSELQSNLCPSLSSQTFTSNQMLQFWLKVSWWLKVCYIWMTPFWTCHILQETTVYGVCVEGSNRLE